MNCKPLLAYWHAVDLPEVTEPLKEIPCDQLHISYFGYPFPHRIAENYFRLAKEYTHLILIPNDLIVTKKDFESMLDFAEKTEYSVCSGVCNVDTDREKDKLNVCFKLPEIPYSRRIYRWLAESQRQHLLNAGVNVINVKFSGFPQMWVKRSVFDKVHINWLDERLQNKDAPPIWETEGGYSNDLAFCHNLNLEGIPIFCNLNVNMLHLRYQGESQIGKKTPTVKLIRYMNGEQITENVPKEQVSKLCEKSTKG